MSRFVHQCPIVLVIIGLLCFSTILQILGLPVTFGNLNGSIDLFESSVLEGFTLIASKPVLSFLFQRLVPISTDSPTYQFSPITLFFHPPTSII